MNPSGPFAPVPRVLEDEHVRLEPLDERHVEGLFEQGLDESVWRYSPMPMFQTRGEAAAYVGRALAEMRAGAAVPFAVIPAGLDGAAGTTRLFDISIPHRSLEIGHTWLGRAFRGSAVNPAMKRLLLGHCFEALGAERVQFKTDSRNLASQRALAAIGAREEGTLRHHMIMPDGHHRDSVYFSVIAPEWPDVRVRLDALVVKRAGR